MYLKNLQQFRICILPQAQCLESFESCLFIKLTFRLALAGYISYLVLFCIGWFREFFFGLGPIFTKNKRKFEEKNRDGYAPLYASYESFYTRNVYRRLKYVFHQPITSCPGAKGMIHVIRGYFYL